MILTSPRSKKCEIARIFIDAKSFHCRASYASVLTIVAFSIERYLAICHPLHMFMLGDFHRTLRVLR